MRGIARSLELDTDRLRPEVPDDGLQCGADRFVRHRQESEEDASFPEPLDPDPPSLLDPAFDGDDPEAFDGSDDFDDSGDFDDPDGFDDDSAASADAFFL